MTRLKSLSAVMATVMLSSPTAFAHQGVTFFNKAATTEVGVRVYRGAAMKTTELAGADAPITLKAAKKIVVVRDRYPPARLRAQGFYSGVSVSYPYTQGFYSGQRIYSR